METVARLVKNSKLSRQVLTDEDIARAAWPLAVGRAIASHTSRIKLVRSTLVVEVEDATWQQQLYRLSSQIIDRLHKTAACDHVQQIEFRIGVPRISPQREDAAPATLQGRKFQFGE